MRNSGLLEAWTASVRLPASPLGAGWWGADPLGVLGRHWVKRLAGDGVVVQIDHAHAEAVLGIAGPEAELSRLLSGDVLGTASSRLVALHAQLLERHGMVTYFTTRPLELLPSVRGWLVAAARAGAAQVLAIVQAEEQLPAEWSKGEESALSALPQPVVGVGDVYNLASPGLTRGVPALSLAAFIASCGSRLDVVELALGAWESEEQARFALLRGSAGQRAAGSPLDGAMATLLLTLNEQERELAGTLASHPGAYETDGAQVEAMVSLAGRGLVEALGGRGRPRARMASELMRTAIQAHLLEPGRASPVVSGGWETQVRRLHLANEAMDPVSGRAPAQRLLQLRRSWDQQKQADLVVALLLEHHFLSDGAGEALRRSRHLGVPGPLSRGMLVRASFESGEIYHSVAELARRELGRTPTHRDDDLVLDLAPASPLRELMRTALRAGERGDIRRQAVALGRLVRAAIAPQCTQEGIEALGEAFDRRLYRVTAGQGLLTALGMGGYRALLETVTDRLVREVRPWHGALAGAGELALALDESARGWGRAVEARFERAVNHAQAWHHGTIARVVQVLATGAWYAGGELGQDTEGALFRGKREFMSTWIAAMMGDGQSIVALAATDVDGEDARSRAMVLWARGALGLVNRVGAATSLVHQREDFLALWLVNAALTLDPGREHPETRALVEQAGGCRAEASRGLEALSALVAQGELTQREAEVERARLAGEDTGVTAARLGIGERTVQGHRATAKAKADELAQAGFALVDARRWTLELSELA
jgi:DNA-binding CsgD family transcriptional regulator